MASNPGPHVSRARYRTYSVREPLPWIIEHATPHHIDQSQGHLSRHASQRVTYLSFLHLHVAALNAAIEDMSAACTLRIS